MLGSAFNAETPELLENMNIKYILNVANECNDLKLGDKYMKINVLDIVETGHLQLETFMTAFKFINKAVSENASILVHCARGRSRSATIVIAYLMRNNGWNLKRAYLEVKYKRNLIGPHSHLKRQLIEYEIFLYGSSSIVYTDWLTLQRRCDNEKTDYIYKLILNEDKLKQLTISTTDSIKSVSTTDPISPISTIDSITSVSTTDPISPISTTDPITLVSTDPTITSCAISYPNSAIENSNSFALQVNSEAS